LKADGFIDELDLTPRGLLSVNYEAQLSIKRAAEPAPDDPRIQTKAIHADKTGKRVGRIDGGYYALGSVLGLITNGIDHFLPRQWK